MKRRRVRIAFTLIIILAALAAFVMVNAAAQAYRQAAMLAAEAAEPWATVYVAIGERGFEPETVTVTAGSAVVWTNNREVPVALALGPGYRVVLPVLMGGAGRHLAPGETREAADMLLGPGQSYTLILDRPGTYATTLEDAAGRGLVHVRPHQIDPPGLAWATGPEGVLLRWRWPRVNDEGRPVARPTGYNVYRDGQLLTPAPVQAVTDPAAAQALLGDDWNWLQATYTEVTTIAGLHAFLDENGLAERWLADQRYRVALLRGLGYLDGGVLPGDSQSHTYMVEAVFPERTAEVGVLTLENNGVTPMDPPTGLQVTSIVSDGLRTAGDWAEAQRNRRGHARLSLIWDLPAEEASRDEAPEQWSTSYDVFRAGPVGAGQDPATMVWLRLTAGDPVVPMADHDPTWPFTATNSYAGVPYERFDAYYTDRDVTVCETYAYRVAARDLLGQAGPSGSYASRMVPDALPPRPPRMLTPTVNYTTGVVALAWEPVADAASYELYRSQSPTATWPSGTCPAGQHCWQPLSSGTATSYVDSPAYEQRYWYVARAWDAACGGSANFSAPSNAVSAILHDRVPPDPPQAQVVPGEPVQIDVPPDTEQILLYCAFDDGSQSVPEPRLIETFTATGQTEIAFQPEEYYTPAVPVQARCATQGMDQHGNLSARANWVSLELCPAEPFTLARPVITQIRSVARETGEWDAELTWEIEADQPGLVQFWIRRAHGGTSELVGMVGPEERQFLDQGVKKNVVYSYTVSAIGIPCGAESGPEVRSAPRLYRVVDPLNRCRREPNALAWRESEMAFTPGSGAFLAWEHPFGFDDVYMRTVVYRSPTGNGDYVALTPPFDSMDYSYLDTDALHGDYWYVVTMLDWASGEILASTEPWSPNHGIGATALDDGSTATPPATDAVVTGDAAIAAARAPEVSDSLAAVADTYITNTSVDQNFGNEDVLEVWYVSDGGDAQGLIHFDLSGIPEGAIFESASFDAYLLDAFLETEEIALYGVGAPWDESTVTWRNQPPLDGPYGSTVVGPVPGWVTWDASALVESWLNGTYENNGLSLVSTSDVAYRVFSSREGVYTPTLRVAYTPLPETLTFGTGDENPFVVTGVTYASGSTPACLTGSGTVALGGGELGATFNRTVSFNCIAAEVETGIVTAGTGTVALPAPLNVSYPGGFAYLVQTLTLDAVSAAGDVDLTLPDGLLFRYQGTPTAPLPLSAATIRQDLTFSAERTWADSCYDPLPEHLFEMDPLPLEIVPAGQVLFFHNHLNLGAVCSRYHERYTDSRPSFPDSDANDGFLRPVYSGTRGAIIDSSGLSVGLRTDSPVAYSTAMPYGFEISATGPISVEIAGSRISDGVMMGVELGLDYYQVPVTKTLVQTATAVPFPKGRFVGAAPGLLIGPGGSVHGEIVTPDLLTWAQDGFVLSEPNFWLYLPPVQSATGNLPWEELEAGSRQDPEGAVQAGLNLVIGEPDGAGFLWNHCCGIDPRTPVVFPEGVSVDVYLRRGGVSDEVSARISLGSPVEVPIYGYDNAFSSFRLSFCDNVIYDGDVAADVRLPSPTHEVVPMVQMVLDPATACVEGGQVPKSELTLEHWQIKTQPRAGEYRDKTARPDVPLEGWTRDLWILGTMSVPHLSPPEQVQQAPIPVETAFRPDGTILHNRPVYNKVNYGMDGFPFLLSSVDLSVYGGAGPEWVPEATLAAPPSLAGGFVRLEGNLVEPIFGTLKGTDTKAPPDLFVLGWDPYVGFSDQPAAKRTWTVLTEITWGFDLIYAQHHDPSTPRGTFAGFRTDDLVVVEADQALILSSWVDPGHTQADLLLGLSAGSGVLRALAETRVASLPATLDTTLQGTMEQWRSEHFPSMDADYISFTGEIWEQYDNPLPPATGYTYADTTEVIDGWADYLAAEQDKSIPDDPAGGGTTKVLSQLLEKTTEWDVQLKKMRGEVVWSTEGTADDYHFEECRFSLWFKVKREQDDEPLVEGERLSFYITRDADYVLEGYDVKAKIYEQPITADFMVAISTDPAAVVGDLVLRDLEGEGVIVDEAAAILGVGERTFFLGALIDNAHPKFSDDWRLGGAILMGWLDTNNAVLKNSPFKSILADIGATGAAAGEMSGFYMRVYGDLRILHYSCMLDVKAGGEVAGWYFADQGGGCDLYGGRLRGRIYGDLLCVVSARGDATLQIYRKPSSDPAAERACADLKMEGEFWAAGGIGFCDPESWDSWASRWWGDSWCWTAGAVIETNYNVTGPGWNWSYDADYE